MKARKVKKLLTDIYEFTGLKLWHFFRCTDKHKKPYEYLSTCHYVLENISSSQFSKSLVILRGCAAKKKN